MLIINRHIYSEIWQRFLWITGLSLLGYLSMQFIDLLSVINATKTYSALLLKILGLKLLSTSPKLLVVTMLIAIILSYSKLIIDNEIIIMSAAGISKLRQLIIVLYACLPIYLIIGGLTFFVSPWAEHEYNNSKNLLVQNAEFTDITAGQFREFNNGNYVIYVESISDNQQNMENIFLQRRDHEELSILTAQKANLRFDRESGHRYITLTNGQHYVLPANTLDYKITEYDSYAITLAPKTAATNVRKKMRTLSTSTLLFSNNPTHQAELQWRISLVLAAVLLSLLAVLLGLSGISKRRLALLLIAMLSYFVYTDLLSISKSLLGHNEIPAAIGLWWVHILLIIYIFALYYAPQIRYFFKTNK